MERNKVDWAKGIRNLTGVLFLVIITLTIAQVFFRFALNRPLVWSEELVRFLLIWMTMIGAAVISYDDKHLSINSFVEILPQKVQFWLYTLRKLSIIIFLVLTIASSIDLIKISHKTLTGAFEMPFSYWRVAAPTGCALIIIYSILRYYENYKLYCKDLYGLGEKHGKEEVK